MKSTYLLGAVLLLSIFGCSGDEARISATRNESATLVGDLPANPLQWKVITSAVEPGDSTMATLYGNDLAAKYARTKSEHNYPSGAVLSLVTWSQREDSRWFGGKIPDQVKAVEFVFVGVAGDGRPSYTCQKYEGTPLKRVSAEEGPALSDRGAYLVSQRAAVMP